MSQRNVGILPAAVRTLAGSRFIALGLLVCVLACGAAARAGEEPPAAPAVELAEPAGELVLPESTAYHERTDPSGQTSVTAVYQESGQILLLRAVDEEVTELTLWKSQYRAPDLYFVRRP